MPWLGNWTKELLHVNPGNRSVNVPSTAEELINALCITQVTREALRKLAVYWEQRKCSHTFLLDSFCSWSSVDKLWLNQEDVLQIIFSNTDFRMVLEQPWASEQTAAVDCAQNSNSRAHSIFELRYFYDVCFSHVYMILALFISVFIRPKS